MSLGYIISPLLLYLFLSNKSFLLTIPFIIELFALIFQTLTLANRTPTNIIPGSSLLQPLTIALLINVTILLVNLFLLFPIFIFRFELINYLIQLFIYSTSSLSYAI